MIVDAHCHDLRSDALVDRSPADALVRGFVYSVGVHPWQAHSFDAPLLERAVRQPEVAAIGETGLDRLRGPDIELQQSVFRAHFELSEELGKPLIVHCVRAADRLLALRKLWRPECAWIFHGFRGKPAAARQLLDAGMYISLGPKFNAATAAAVPADRLLIETDDSGTDIASVARAVAAARGCPAEELTALCACNLARCLGR